MYSKSIQKALKKAKAGIGDRITVGDQEGLLMPSPDVAASPDHVVLKLDNGYNIGIKYENQSIKKLSSQSRAVKPSHSKPNQSSKLKNISFLSSGGTIASKVDYSTGGVNAAMSAEDLVSLVPELGDVARVDFKSVLEKMSEDMGPLDWQLLAKETAKALDKSEGVIITHGTDTLHYTSAALSFMLDASKPVVLTGSQRSSDRGSADSFLNLVCSAHAALSDVAEVVVCMHGESSDSFCDLIRGTKVRKMHSTMRNAFRPINDYPLAKVFPDGKIEPVSKFKKRGKSQAKVDAKFEDNIALVKTFPGSDPGVLDYYVKKGVKGFVVEATALGHVPTKAENSWIPNIKSIVSSGVPVVVATQCVYGTVNPDVYTNLRILFHEAGATPALDMTAETAYVKLGWVLAHAKGEKAKNLMTTNLKGEINNRIQPDMFLY